MSTEFWVVRSCGPSGRMDGEPFHDDVTPADCRVIAVRIYTGEQVHGIQIIHETCDGCRHAFPLHGRAVGACHILNVAVDEFITSISVRYGTQIVSIRVQTNKQQSPLLGGEGGDSLYHYEAPSGAEIVGFCGRAGDALNAIGVLLRRRGL